MRVNGVYSYISCTPTSFMCSLNHDSNTNYNLKPTTQIYHYEQPTNIHVNQGNDQKLPSKFTKTSNREKYPNSEQYFVLFKMIISFIFIQMTPFRHTLPDENSQIGFFFASVDVFSPISNYKTQRIKCFQG